MKTKTMIIIGVVVLALAIAGYFFMKKPATAETPADSGLGKKKNGSPYFQSDIDLTVRSIKGTPTWLADVQVKATKAGRSIDEQLKMEAKWMLENA
ncbi:hypothetical protein JZU46_01110 [bacterium]|jgi:flagellar basal body-associated protein FliL|nr:hypothetical protein [bacterium]